MAKNNQQYVQKVTQKMRLFKFFIAPLIGFLWIFTNNPLHQLIYGNISQQIYSNNRRIVQSNTISYHLEEKISEISKVYSHYQNNISAMIL